MAKPSAVTPVKLFVVTIHSDLEILRKAVALLVERYGPIDFESEDFSWDITNYYEQEMGTGLLRRFYSFENLILPDQLVEAKLFCNKCEEEFSIESRRQINLDPAYLDLYKLVLASAKFGGQKIYLRDGIYADMTLVMYKRKWESFTWGFPDFKSRKYDAVLCKIRDLYKSQLRLS